MSLAFWDSKAVIAHCPRFSKRYSIFKLKFKGVNIILQKLLEDFYHKPAFLLFSA